MNDSKPIFLSLIAVSAMTVAACTGEKKTEPTPTAETPAVTEDVNDDVQLPLQVTIVENVYPQADNVRGNASYAGSDTRGYGRAESGLVEDNDGTKFGYYEAVRSDLQPGSYRLELDLKQEPGRAEHAMIRVNPGDGLDFKRGDLTIAPDGMISREKGDISDVDVGESDVDGYRNIRLSFTVKDAGQYRILVYPAIGFGGELDAGSTGTVGVGGIKLTQVQ